MTPRTGGRRGGAARGGFVLPVALMALVVLSMASVTGLYLARNDFRAAEATRHAVVALAAADAGAARTVALWGSLVPALPGPGDSLVLDWQTLPDGSAYRSVVRRTPISAGETAPPRVLLSTTGRVAPPGAAHRTVLTVVEVSGAAAPCCDAALTLTGGVRVTGVRNRTPNSGVDGTDRIPPGWSGTQCPDPLRSLPGVLARDADAVQVRTDGEIGGAPPVTEDPTLLPSGFTSFGSVTYAEMTAMADARYAGNTVLRDAVGPVVAGGACVTSVRNNWGSPLTPSGPCGSHAPIVHVSGNLTLQGRGQGQGILLVDGDLTISGEFVHYGWVVVLGRLRLNAPGRLHGGVSVRGGANGNSQSEVTQGGRIEYSGCAVRLALARLPGGGQSGGLKATERSWFEVMR